jgi:hypothetical protein
MADIALFEPKKCDIENHEYLLQPCNAHFTPKKRDIGPNSGVILSPFLIVTEY